MSKKQTFDQVATIDLGYGFTKGMSPGKPPFICSSLVSPARQIRYAGGLSASNGIQVDVGANSYFVGDKAEVQGRGPGQTLSSARIGTVEQMALFYAAASELVKLATDTVLVVTGLPVADYTDENMALLEDSLMGEHIVRRTGQSVRQFEVTKVVVIPQAVGAIYDMFLDKDGLVTQNEHLQRGIVATVDVGQFTTNFVTLNGLKYVDHMSTSSEVGVSRILLDIQGQLRSEYGLSLEKLSLVDKAVRVRSVSVKGQPQDIGPLVDRYSAELADAVLAQAKSLWGAGVDLSAVVLTGGGSHLLADRVRQVYDHTLVAPNAQFGNVQGYLKMALRFTRG